MSMMGITFNVHALCFFAAHGLSGAASTRVGNELGAGRPRLAWLNTQVWAHTPCLDCQACRGGRTGCVWGGRLLWLLRRCHSRPRLAGPNTQVGRPCLAHNKVVELGEQGT
eukprot:366296-Chlamydomonas_euryale.AAC.6